MSEVTQETIDVAPAGTAPVDAQPAAEKDTSEATPTSTTENGTGEVATTTAETEKGTGEVATTTAETEKGEASAENKSKNRGGQREFNNRREHHHQSATKYNSGRNSKFDPSTMPVTDDASKIRAQVEFYFGDANLPSDKFMWETTDGTSNKPVPIKTLHSFKRMQRFQPYSAVVDALKQSTFLEVSGEEGSEVVKRKVAYDPSFKDIARDRTIYVKGFGEEKPSTQFDIEAFFTVYGPTNMVRLRRHEDGLFKGSVFVEFSDEKTAQDFLKLEPKPLWEGKDELKIMSKAEYMEEKNQLIKEGKMEPNQTKPFYGPAAAKARGRGGRGNGFRGGKDRGDRDPDDWKRRRDDDQKSGFRDNKRGRGNRDGRGRGRGRGNDRGHRNGRRDDESESRGRGNDEEAKEAQEPRADVAAESIKKREREDDGAEDKPAKKQDTKETVSVEAA